MLRELPKIPVENLTNLSLAQYNKIIDNRVQPFAGKAYVHSTLLQLEVEMVLAIQPYPTLSNLIQRRSPLQPLKSLFRRRST